MKKSYDERVSLTYKSVLIKRVTKLTLTILTSSNNPLFTIHHQKISNPQSKIEPAGKPSQGISLCSIQIQWSLSSHWFEIQLYLICCSHFHEKNLGSVHYWSPISKKCIRYLRTDKEVTWHHFAWKTFHKSNPESNKLLSSSTNEQDILYLLIY